MKDIGIELKNKREENGVSVEEAAEDLKLRPTQIINLEDGNMEYFKDIFNLKYFIRDYAKYLGLDFEKLLDQFNEFIFDYTSKIPVDQIERAKEENSKNSVQKEFVSPYTSSNEKKRIPSYVIYIIVGFVLLVAGFIIFMSVQGNNDTSKITYVIEKR